ncbi:MAG: cullin, a subunit of ubiquitin ligase [Ilumatobacteraceae bacterium]|nr:cullin, a subunit of ubiquitin ligase [Ilumatobacteraceae bacterium]
MARVVASRPAWREALQSDLESRVVDEIRAQLLPAPEAQWPLQLGDGRHVRLDFAWPEHRVALEVDHPFWHAGAAESHRDRGRDRLLMTMGWIVPRITSVDVATGLAASIADVGVILAARSLAA